MARTSSGKLSEPEKDSWLPDVIADAIHSAYARYGRSKNPTPFLFNLLDYLELSATSPAQICLWKRSSGTSHDWRLPFPEKLSSATKSPIQPLSEKSLIGIQAAHAHTLDRVKELIKRLDQYDRRLSQQVPAALTKALENIDSLRRATSAWYAEETAEPVSTFTHDTSRIDEILDYTQRNLSLAIGLAEDTCQVVIRYWSGRRWNFRILSSDTQALTSDKKGLEIPKQWVEEISETFQLGCARLRPVSKGKQLLCIPVHFGGVPWLVLCRECEDSVEGRWSAYVTYRDLAAGFNAAIRSLAPYSYAAEMRRILLHHVAGARGKAAEVQREVERGWMALASVYPVRRPRFVSQDQTVNPDAIMSLSFAAEEWRIGFFDAGSFILNCALVLESNTREQWGRIQPAVLKTAFLDPVMAELQKQDVQRAIELADSTYGLGHPLKHRFGRIKGALDNVRSELAHTPPSIAQAKTSLLEARNKLIAATATASVMDLMANVSLKHGDVTQLDSKFYLGKKDPFPLGGRIGALLQEFEDVGECLVVSKADVNAIAPIVVNAWIETKDGRKRLFNEFYEDVLFELLFNAFRHSPGTNKMLEIRLQSIVPDGANEAVSCLTLSNPTTESKERHFARISLKPEQWRAWDVTRNGPQGGLRLLANQLSLTQAGRIFARPFRRKESWWLSIAMQLRGMERS